MTDSVRALILDLPLKEMDGTLLISELMVRARLLHAVWEFNDDTDIPRWTHDHVLGVESAIQAASYLHRKQRRRNRGDLPKDPYVNHPLRNALRLMRYGVTDLEVIQGAILHDTLEDCWEEMSSLVAYMGPDFDQYDHSYSYLERSFSVKVAAYVEAVSNEQVPEGTSKAKKREIYAEHVRKVVTDNPAVWLIKFSDWVDNAAGLYHNVGDNPEMIKHLTAKYIPLIEIFIDTWNSDVSALVSEEGVEMIKEHLRLGTESLNRLSESVV